MNLSPVLIIFKLLYLFLNKIFLIEALSIKFTQSTQDLKSKQN